jgi:hypothetical protein
MTKALCVAWVYEKMRAGGKVAMISKKYLGRLGQALRGRERGGMRNREDDADGEKCVKKRVYVDKSVMMSERGCVLWIYQAKGRVSDGGGGEGGGGGYKKSVAFGRGSGVNSVTR